MTAMDVREVLADPGQGGAYFVDARDNDSLIEAASALEFSVTRIDLAGCRDKDTALDRIAAALRFPEWFGANFDALADCLGDLSWLPADGYLLLLEHSDEWRQGDDEISPPCSTSSTRLRRAGAIWGCFTEPCCRCRRNS